MWFGTVNYEGRVGCYWNIYFLWTKTHFRSNKIGATKYSLDAPNRKVSWTILSLNSLPFLLDKTVQDKTIWFGEKILFPDLLTTSNVRWNNIGTQTPNRKAEKTYEKLMILIEKSEIFEEQLYCFGNYSYISHSYNFKPRTRESGNAWTLITENFSS